MIPLAFLVSTWFNRARLASIFGPFCLFALLLPRYLFFRTNSDQAIGLKRLSALLSPTAFAFAADSLGAFEGGNVGVSTSNLFSGPLSIGSMILFMWLDTVIYTLLAWYCDRVLPGAVGSPREPFFCFRPSYWMPQPALEHGYAGDALSEPAAASDDVEPPAVAGAPPAVRIRNLHKTFGSGKRALAAVSGLDLDLFDSTITCLLGHNGAGKARPTTFCYFLALIFLSQTFSLIPHHPYQSTTISMLTGLLPVTSGDITVCGFSVRTQLASARRSLGVCPQQNVLFPLLTVAEHLALCAFVLHQTGTRAYHSSHSLSFSRLNAHPRSRRAQGRAARSRGGRGGRDLRCSGAPREGDRPRVVAVRRPEAAPPARPRPRRRLQGGAVRRANLRRVKFSRESALSRRCSIDRPSNASDNRICARAGQDPVSRRQTWALLRSLRPGRAILLTTHYLEARRPSFHPLPIRNQIFPIPPPHPPLTRRAHPPAQQEADLLADTVAVLSSGALRAAGSPLFLKRRFGGGATLRATRTDVSDGGASVRNVSELLDSLLPGASLARTSGGEAVWALPPPGSIRPGAMSAALAAVEAARGSIGVAGFAVASASLEEVFLALAHDAPATLHAAGGGGGGGGGGGAFGARRGSRGGGGGSDASPAGHADQPVQHEMVVIEAPGSVPPAATPGEAFAEPAFAAAVASDDSPPPRDRTPRRAFAELLRKRAVCASRDAKGLATQVLLPVAAVLLVLLVLKLDIDPVGPELPLSAAFLATIAGFTGRSLPVIVAPPSPVFATDFSASVAFQPLPDARIDTATGVSRWLLAHPVAGPPFRYAAFVPSDPDLPRLAAAACLSEADGPRLGAAAVEALSKEERVSEARREAASRLATSVLRSSVEANASINILHNASVSYALPMFLSELHNAMSASSGGPAIAASSHPLPLTPAEAATLATFVKVLASFFLLVPLAYLPATYAAFVVRERSSGAKLQQLASGCGGAVYWASSFVWEGGVHTLVTALCVTLFACFGLSVLVGSFAKAIGVWLLLQLYGFACIPLSFLASFAFASAASATVALAVFHFVTGFCFVNGSFILSLTPSKVDLNNQLVVFFRLFPAFCLGEGLVALATEEFTGLAGAPRLAPQTLHIPFSSQKHFRLTFSPPPQPRAATPPPPPRRPRRRRCCPATARTRWLTARCGQTFSVRSSERRAPPSSGPSWAARCCCCFSSGSSIRQSAWRWSCAARRRPPRRPRFATPRRPLFSQLSHPLSGHPPTPNTIHTRTPHSRRTWAWLPSARACSHTPPPRPTHSPSEGCVKSSPQRVLRPPSEPWTNCGWACGRASGSPSSAPTGCVYF